jgi:hypothetical protein
VDGRLICTLTRPAPRRCYQFGYLCFGLVMSLFVLTRPTAKLDSNPGPDPHWMGEEPRVPLCVWSSSQPSP